MTTDPEPPYDPDDIALLLGLPEPPPPARPITDLPDLSEWTDQ